MRMTSSPQRSAVDGHPNCQLLVGYAENDSEVALSPIHQLLGPRTGEKKLSGPSRGAGHDGMKKRDHAIHGAGSLDAGLCNTEGTP